MLIILSGADSCTIPTNNIVFNSIQYRTKSVAFFVEFSTLPYMNTQISQHLSQMDVMSVEVSPNFAA